MSESLGQRNHPCLPSSARAPRRQLPPSPRTSPARPVGALLCARALGKGSAPLPPARSPAQRNEWCSTLQKKVMEQRLLGSRPRPANTAHCQKSGTLELKGHKSKVFAALSLPEMWLYKSEQVRGQGRPLGGMRGMEGTGTGPVPKAEQRGKGWAGKREWQSRKVEILPRAAGMGTRSGSPSLSPNYRHLQEAFWSWSHQTSQSIPGQLDQWPRNQQQTLQGGQQ